MRIAQIAPLTEAVPPKLYGGTERVVAYLTDALIELGHEVTLFAAGDSLTKAKLVPIWPRALRLDATIKDHLVPLFNTVGNRGAARSRIRRYSLAPRLLRLSVVAALGGPIRYDIAWPARFAGTAAALRTVRRHPGRLDLQLAARTLAAGQLCGNSAARLAARLVDKRLRTRRISGVSRPHFTGKSPGCRDSNRRTSRAASQDRRQGRSRR